MSRAQDEITYRAPRTLQQAFGPYTDDNLTDQKGYRYVDPPLDWQDELILWGCAITVLAVVLLALGGVI